MNSDSVFFLEDDLDLGAVLKQVAEGNGANAIWADSVGSMIDQRSEVLKCKIAFLDIELGRDLPNGIDAFEWLEIEDFPGRIFFLTGHGKGHPLVAKAHSIGKAEVLAKPFSPPLLLKLIGAN